MAVSLLSAEHRQVSISFHLARCGGPIARRVPQSDAKLEEKRSQPQTTRCRFTGKAPQPPPRSVAHIKFIIAVEIQDDKERFILARASLVACQPRPLRVTTQPDGEGAVVMPDLVKRDFTTERPGLKFVGDITYLHTWQGFVYLARVIDCSSKKVVG